MSGNFTPISVSILGRDYQFTCAPEEQQALKAAAALLDERMREIKKSGNLMALERVAVMTALNLADELLKLKSRDQQRTEQVDNRLRRLADQVDSALSSRLD